jgi:branched-subunit amino acid aminotransferase/4-amino-4-deoxychorismate lyase
VNAALPVSIDGVIVPAHEARILVSDPAFTQGLSAFDTLLVEAGRAHLRDRHLRRLRATCAFLHVDERALVRLEEWLAGLVERLPATPLAVRTTVTRDGRIVITARVFDPVPADGVVLAIEPHLRLSGDDLDRHKTSSRARLALAREAARARGAFDALLCHADGDVVDATSANVWVHLDGEIVTPPLARGALAGVVRGVLLEDLGVVRERSLALTDLARAAEVFVTSSLHRVAGVRSILGCVDGLGGQDGVLARRALEIVRSAERRET